MSNTSNNVPDWKVSGDWFDVCKCSIPCPCEFAQAPTYGDCDGVLAYHIRNGHYGEAALDGLNALTLSDPSKGISGLGKREQVLDYFLMKKPIHINGKSCK